METLIVIIVLTPIYVICGSLYWASYKDSRAKGNSKLKSALESFLLGSLLVGAVLLLPLASGFSPIG